MKAAHPAWVSLSKEVSGAYKIELFFDTLAVDITASGLKMNRVEEDLVNFGS